MNEKSENEVKKMKILFYMKKKQKILFGKQILKIKKMVLIIYILQMIED